MFSVVVSDDVWVSKRGENRKLGVELFPLFLRHAHVVDFFATEDLPVLLSAHLSNYTKGTMSWNMLVFVATWRMHMHNSPIFSSTSYFSDSDMIPRSFVGDVRKIFR